MRGAGRARSPLLAGQSFFSLNFITRIFTSSVFTV
jgi:hypothetical protein